MKILYFGGQKSGKSTLAEKKTLQIAADKPYYLATYDNSYDDGEMQVRIDRHRQTRQSDFITLEEPRNLARMVEPGHTYLIDCVSMWLLNRIEDEESVLID